MKTRTIIFIAAVCILIAFALFLSGGRSGGEIGFDAVITKVELEHNMAYATVDEQPSAAASRKLPKNIRFSTSFFDTELKPGDKVSGLYLSDSISGQDVRVVCIDVIVDEGPVKELIERFLTTLYTSDAERYNEFKQSEIYNDPTYDPAELSPEQFPMYTDLYTDMCSEYCINVMIETYGNMLLAVDKYAEKYGYDRIYVSGVTCDVFEKSDDRKSTVYDCTVDTYFEKDNRAAHRPISVRVTVSHTDNLIISFRPKDAVLLNPLDPI